jgi:hypothetical protein
VGSRRNKAEWWIWTDQALEDKLAETDEGGKATMYRQLSCEQREAIFLERAMCMYAALERWYDEHPQASFGEIEEAARRFRRELMGEGLAILINGRDTGYQLTAPKCEACGQEMTFKGHHPWGISGLEGETRLMRAYYACPECEGETFFPPGPEVEASGGPLE